MKPLARGVKHAICAAVALVSAAGAAMVATAQTAPSLGEILELSSRLYQEGVARRDAILIVAAARLRLTHLAAERAPGPPGWVSGVAMLRVAEEFAASDEGVREMIARLGEETVRGGLEGPQVASVLVRGLGEVRLPHGFKGGRPAYVYAEGALTSRLSIAVLDGRTTVCQTRVEPGRALCRWVAVRDGPVTTIVRNRSSEAVTVLVVTN